MQEKSVSEAIDFRRSVRVYDPEKTIDQKKVKKCIIQATLSPSSSNMQLWEFHHIISKYEKGKIVKSCFNQPAAKTAEQIVIVVVRKDLWRKRLDSNVTNIKSSLSKIENLDPNLKKKSLRYYNKLVPLLYSDFFGLTSFIKKIYTKVVGLYKPIYREVGSCDLRVVSHKSAALAAQSFMVSMAGIGYDTCPMEGFDSNRIKKDLDLPSKVEISMVIGCGIRKEEGVYGKRFRIPTNEIYYSR
ncbi:MAG: nitroreductase family protein [Flavobacteriaceae bacterium]|nr:nitroreductase family protein [Flavobacteriaceae bacterium]